jgi:hypothetical protein
MTFNLGSTNADDDDEDNEEDDKAFVILLGFRLIFEACIGTDACISIASSSRERLWLWELHGRVVTIAVGAVETDSKEEDASRGFLVSCFAVRLDIVGRGFAASR